MPYVVGLLLLLLLLLSYAVGYSIFALKSFTLALSDDICYIIESPLGGPDSRVILTTLSHYIVRLTEGLLYVSAVRSNDALYCLFASITNLYSFVLNPFQPKLILVHTTVTDTCRRAYKTCKNWSLCLYVG